MKRFLFIFPVIMFLLVPVSVSASWMVNSSGELVRIPDVLGESSQVSDEEVEQVMNMLDIAETSPTSPLLTADPETLKQMIQEMMTNVEVYTNEQGQIEAIVTDPETGTKSKATYEDGKVETEVRNPDGSVEKQTHDVSQYEHELEELKTNQHKATDSAHENQNEHKLELEATDAGMQVTDTATKQTHQLGEDMLEIEPNQQAQNVRVLSTATGEMIIAQGRVAARTAQPLVIDTRLNQLVTEMSQGERRIDVLPPAAVSSLLAQDLIDVVDSSGETVAELELVATIITLIEKDNTLAYQIDGTKDQKVLGLVPVKVQRTYFVSAETGELLGQEQAFGQRVLDIIAF